MKRQGTGKSEERRKSKAADDPGGLAAAARVVAAGGRVPKNFAKARPVSAGPTLGAAAASAKITPARRVAFEILTLVAAGKGHSDELLHGVRMDALAEADRHLATALVMGVLRWGLALDATVRGLLERPGQRLADEVALVLRIGAFQLLHMDRIPPHAALSESVEMCRAAGQPHAAGMVNAVLRKVAAARRAPRSAEHDRRESESTEAFAERLGHPAWLVRRWVTAYGRDAALRICEGGQHEPVAGRLMVADPALPQLDDGSRLVAEIAAAALPAIEGRAARVWDCCAAPGGKTLVLAARLPEAEILATDISEKRMKSTEIRLRRSRIDTNVRIEVVNASDLAPERGDFDLILCDVPCSGTGTLGRNPEIRERLYPEELARQAVRQHQILTAALARLAPGGRLVYSTCSLEPEENEQVIASSATGFVQVPVKQILVRLSGLVGSADELVRGGALRTLPGVHPCDGFYAVVLERENGR